MHHQHSTNWKYYSIFALLFIYLNVFAQPGWYSVSWGYEYGHHAVFFVSPDTGWVANEGGHVSKTTDGGQKWITQYTGNNDHPTDLFFLNSKTGWMATDGLKVLKTEDGGNSWQTVFNGESYSDRLISVCFVNNQIGWAVGKKFFSAGSGSDSTVIIKTNNGGSDWNYQTAGTQDFQLNSVFFLDENMGWVAGYRGKIFKSTNGGDNWVEQNSNTLSNLWSIYFIDPNTGWAVGENGIILKTEDGGTNWFGQNNPVSTFLVSLQFLNKDIGYACGMNGTILKTTEAGTEWQQQVSGTSQGLIDLHFLSPDTGYVVGWYGTILKTTNGGVGTNTIERIKDNIPQSLKLDQNFPNPFNSTTKIRFSIHENDFISLEIYNISGQLVDVLVNSILVAGTYTVNWDASEKMSGVYHAILKSNKYQKTIKLLFIR